MVARRHLLAFASTLAVAAAIAAPAQAACPGGATEPTAANLQAVKATTLCLLNERRAQDGLKPLAADATLEGTATRYSLRMVAERFFAHIAPDGTDPLSRVLANGLRLAGDWLVGENLAYGTGDLGTPERIVQKWMDSPGHRMNILNDGFSAIGIGITVGTPVGSATSGATYTTDFSSAVAKKKATPKKKHKKHKAKKHKKKKQHTKAKRRKKHTRK